MDPRTHDIGAYITSRAGLAPVTINSDSTGAGDNQDGLVIDRLNDLGQLCLSAKAVVHGHRTGSTGKQSTLTLSVLHSDTSGSGFTAFSTDTNPADVTVGTTSTGTPSADEVIEQDVDLAGAKQFIKLRATADFTATSSGESVALDGVVIFGGAGEVPVS